MNKSILEQPDQEKLLYKLVIQFLIYCQGSHKSLDPYLLQIGKRLKSGSSLGELTPELLAISKTLLHISKQAEPLQPESKLQQHDYVLKRIDDLLLKTDVPLGLQQKKSALRQKFRASDQSFNGIIDAAIALLMDIKDHATVEQKGIDTFLSDLTGQIGEIEQHVEHVGQSARLSIDQRQHLNAEINQQVGDIKESTQQAEELAVLKKLTSEHLDRLMQQLLEHKQQEDERQQQAELQIGLMSEKLQLLETETKTLRTKLKLEHERSLRDPLTGLPNRLAYKDRIEMEISRWRRYRAPLSLAILDIDYFKRINDTYGHKAGDKTLTLVGQLLMNNCRASDFVARYGGEEFVMLMPNSHADQALMMAEKIRAKIEQSGFNYNGEEINLTLSGGICEFSNDDQHEDVFVRADHMLYQAKQAGRNRCLVYSPEFIATGI